MTDLPKTLKQLLSRSKRPLGVSELLHLAGLHPGQQTVLKRTLRELVRQGELTREGKRFLLPARPPVHHVPPEHPGKAPPGAPRGRFVSNGRMEPREQARWDRSSGRPERFAREERYESPRRQGREERFSRGRRGGEEAATVEGVLHVHRDGYGFVHPSSGQGDNIFLPPHEVERALDNDRVLVEAWGRPGRMEGRLLKVLERPRQLAVGTYAVRGRHGVVLPHDKSLPGTIRVPRTQMAQEGDVVRVRLGVGSRLLGSGEGLYGEVAGSLGRPGEPSAEVLSIAYAQGFADEFPPEVMDEADAVPLEVSEEEARGEGRRDLRSLPLVTIDGEDARDFDDAVYAERHPQGWRLVVAIADVTHYVRERSALDAEALRRATSVYMPGRVLPMLPERLSNGTCSLRPDEDRLCMVADLVIDRQGSLRSSELYPAVMRSHARCTYNEVQDVLDGRDVPHRSALKPHFERLMELARVLRGMRMERGAIDFDLPEHKVVLGEDGRPERMELRERKESHRLIEECMLAANEAVARFFYDEGLPSVYRFHGEPDDEKLAVFSGLAQQYGFFLRPNGGASREGVSSKDLSAFISQLQGHPEQRALNQLLLRSMMQAVYTASSVGHYGLAAEYYLHFTSPIRRYPDLLVHRLLKAHWRRAGRQRSPAELEREELLLEDMAVQSSERERAAMQVEREVVSFYAALLVKDRVGEEFTGTVAALTDFGFFVELEGVHVEGLVKTEALGRGGRFDKLQHAMVYADGTRVRVGQLLRVRLASVNVPLRRIDLEPLEFIERASPPEVPEPEAPAAPTEQVVEPPVAARPPRVRKAPAKKAAAKRAVAKRAVAKKAAAKKSAPAANKAARKAPASKAPAKKAVAKRAAVKSAPRRTTKAHSAAKVAKAPKATKGQKGGSSRQRNKR